MPWRGRNNNSTGTICFINACLSSLPMFLMGFYRLTDRTHASIERHRSAFYWNSADNKKYILVKLKLMCRPKNMGGLGIINMAVMNKCLIIKWWWRILTADCDTLWLKLLKAKYFPNSSPMFTSAAGGSQFWRNLVKVRDDFRAHVKFLVGNGTSVRFWLDWWTRDATLASSFLILFSYCSNPYISISELAANN